MKLSQRIESVQGAMRANPRAKVSQQAEALRKRIGEGKIRKGITTRALREFAEETPPSGLDLVELLRWARERWAVLRKIGKIRLSKGGRK